MVSDGFQELDVDFAVIKSGVDGPSEGDIKVWSDLFGEDLGVIGEDSEIKWLKRFRSEEDFVNGDFDFLDFHISLGFGVIVCSDPVKAI